MTIAEEQAELDELERGYQDGLYTELEMPVRYVEWLGAAKMPAFWWARMPNHVRAAVLEQVAVAAAGGVSVGGELTVEEEQRYHDLLGRLARDLGLL